MRWIALLVFGTWCTLLDAHQYHFRLLPTDFGADIRQIDLLYQGPDGIVWIGTDQGLYHFDGRRYTYIPRDDNAQVSVTAIAADPDGRIWAGYEDGYILITGFAGNRKHLQVDSLAGTSISKIVFASPQNIFISTYGKGLWHGDGGFFARVMYDELASITDIYDALVDRDQKLWLATDDGIRIYTPLPNQYLASLKREQGLRDDIVTHLVRQSSGDILIGFYDQGIQLYQVEHEHIRDVLQGSNDQGSLLAIQQGASDAMWMSTTKSIWMSDPGSALHKIDLPAELQQGISAMLYDRDGNLWIASGNKLYLANTQIEFVEPGLASIQAILPLGDKLWYGCESGLYSTDIHGDNLVRYFTNAHINVLSLYSDQQGVLWIGTFGQGLYLLDPGTGRSLHLTEADKLSNSSILNIAGRSKQVWLATLGGITELQWNDHPLDGSLAISDLQTRYQFPPGYVYDVFVSQSGRVWFGTDGKGLFYLDSNGLQKMPVEVWLPDSTTASIRTIYSIAEDAKQQLWVSTTKGLVLCLRDDMRVMDHTITPQGLVNSLVVDGNGDILVIRESEINIVSDSSRLVGLAGAFDLSSFTPNINATAVDPDGTVWIADADRLLHYHAFPGAESKGALLNFEAIAPGDWQVAGPLRLKPDSNFLDIRFVGLWYADPAAVHYRYKLEGHDQEWIYTQERRAVYSRLSPGNYTFVVQAARGLDFDKVSQLSKEIIVLPPFYQRWWFIASFLILAGGLVYWFIRGRINRLNQMHKLEKEKTTHQLHAIQAQVNPHFLFNSFNTLSSIIEEDQAAAVDYVDQLAAFFRGALMHREDELIPIAQEMEIVRNYTYILQKRYGENIRIVEKIENATGLIAPLSIQLLVENAIKHNRVSADKPLIISIGIDMQWATVSNPIQPKFQSAGESTGFGLSSLVTRYAYLTPKKIEIRNADHTFTVRIPILYPDPSK